MEGWSNEQLKHQTERAKSDAELINKGAEYVADKEAKEPRLEVAEESVEKIKEDFGNSIEYIQNKYQDNPEEKKRLVGLVKKLQTLGAHMHERIYLRTTGDSESNYSYSALVDDKVRILLYPGAMYQMELNDIDDIEAHGDNELKINVKKEVFKKVKEYQKESYGSAVKNRNPYA